MSFNKTGCVDQHHRVQEQVFAGAAIGFRPPAAEEGSARGNGIGWAGAPLSRPRKQVQSMRSSRMPGLLAAPVSTASANVG